MVQYTKFSKIFVKTKPKSRGNQREHSQFVTKFTVIIHDQRSFFHIDRHIRSVQKALFYCHIIKGLILQIITFRGH